MSKVSLIIPFYNAQDYLHECIKSAQEQSLDDIEIILINDGSTDKSFEIAQNFLKSDNRIKFFNRENCGYGASVNFGIKKAQSEFISILEADDFMARDMLEKLYHNSKNCEIVKSSFYFYPKNQKYSEIKNQKTNVFKNPEILTLKPSIWSAIYSREFLIKNSIFMNEEKNKSFQDVSFQFKAFLCAKNIVFLDSPLYYYRQNPHQSVKSKNKIYDILDEFNLIDEFMKNLDFSDEIYVQKTLFELKAYIWNFKRTKSFDFLKKASKKLKCSKYNLTKEKNIKLKDKIKFFLLTNFLA